MGDPLRDQLDELARAMLVTALAIVDDYDAALTLAKGSLTAVAAEGAQPGANWLNDGTTLPDDLGLIRIRDLDDFARSLPEHVRKLVPERVACVTGRDRIERLSDLWWQVHTEVSWASLGDSNDLRGNPEEVHRVNRYDVDPNAGPTWLRIRAFDYVPGALAFGLKHATPADIVAEVKRRVRTTLEQTGGHAPGVDFSPLPPLP